MIDTLNLETMTFQQLNQLLTKFRADLAFEELIEAHFPVPTDRAARAYHYARTWAIKKLIEKIGEAARRRRSLDRSPSFQTFSGMAIGDRIVNEHGDKGILKAFHNTPVFPESARPEEIARIRISVALEDGNTRIMDPNDFIPYPKDA